MRWGLEGSILITRSSLYFPLGRSPISITHPERVLSVHFLSLLYRKLRSGTWSGTPLFVSDVLLEFAELIYSCVHATHFLGSRDRHTDRRGAWVLGWRWFGPRRIDLPVLCKSRGEICINSGRQVVPVMASKRPGCLEANPTQTKTNTHDLHYG